MRRPAPCTCVPLLLATLAGLTASAAAAVDPGDIVAPQSDNQGTVIVADPATGDREILSLFPDIGSGPGLFRPQSIAMLPEGDFLVADISPHAALTRIDHATGDRTDVSRMMLGTGPWDTPNTVMVTPAGETLLVAGNFLASVDLATGDRKLLSGLGTGSGPNFSVEGAGGAALDPQGGVVIGAYLQSAVYRVDPATGARSVVSGLGRGDGPDLPHVLDVAVMPDGRILASTRTVDGDSLSNSLIGIDPETGDRTVLTRVPFLNFEYTRLAATADGQLLGSVATPHDAIYSLDPTTGARRLISGDALGTGPSLFWGDMVVFPEPGAAAAALAAACAVFTSLGRRRAAGRAEPRLQRRPLAHVAD